VDTGATHNFVADQEARRLGLKRRERLETKMKVGGSSGVKTERDKKESGGKTERDKEPGLSTIDQRGPITSE
jgi:hypothetical protein